MIDNATTAIFNIKSPFFGWYVMPEAYSPSLVYEYINEFGILPGQTILDPFSGTGTTILAAKLHGFNGVGIEVNPYLAFVIRIKTRLDINLLELKQDFKNVELSIPTNDFEIDQNFDLLKPNMPRLDRWMSPTVTKKVLTIKEAISKLENPKNKEFILLSLSSILREVSNMKLSPHAFGSRKEKIDAPVYELFFQKTSWMISDLESIQGKTKDFGEVEVYQDDIRSVDTTESKLLPADLAVTSPPYLNNLDYTMQTRMELFFLDFVEDMIDLRSIRKSMVTSDAKAMYKDIKDHEFVENISSVQNIILGLKEVHKDKNWGWDYSFMTAQYFGGIFRMFQNVLTMLKPDARYVIITGESSHSGILVPVPDITAELGLLAGFDIDDIRTLRIRRSSSHNQTLKECAVILRKK